MKKLLKNVKGFTLTELLIITAIIGIAAMAAFPNFERAVSQIKVRNSGRHMVSMMRLARSYAITNKVDVGVHFDERGTAMTLFVNSGNPDFEYFDSGDSVMVVDSLPPEFTYVYGSSSDPENPSSGSSIVYRPNGSASSSTYFHFLAESGNYIDWGLIEVLGSTGRTKLAYLESY